jgi:hypothetical protein
LEHAVSQTLEAHIVKRLVQLGVNESMVS